MKITNCLVPIPTYFTLGHNPLPEQVKDRILSSGGEVTENLVFLGKLITVPAVLTVKGYNNLIVTGKASVFNTAQGLKIGAVGGAYDQAHFDSDAVGGPLSLGQSPSILCLSL